MKLFSKQAETITPITPLIETKLEGIANRVVAEINGIAFSPQYQNIQKFKVS